MSKAEFDPAARAFEFGPPGIEEFKAVRDSALALGALRMTRVRTVGDAQVVSLVKVEHDTGPNSQGILWRTKVIHSADREGEKLTILRRGEIGAGPVTTVFNYYQLATSGGRVKLAEEAFRVKPPLTQSVLRDTVPDVLVPQAIQGAIMIGSELFPGHKTALGSGGCNLLARDIQTW